MITSFSEIKLCQDDTRSSVGYKQMINPSSIIILLSFTNHGQLCWLGFMRLMALCVCALEYIEIPLLLKDVLIQNSSSLELQKSQSKMTEKTNKLFTPLSKLKCSKIPLNQITIFKAEFNYVELILKVALPF